MKYKTTNLPLVARDHIVEQVLDRLLRPDDVRQSPDDFIWPGFYGLGGIGKSRLLNEISQRCKEATEYVITIDFEQRKPIVPANPVEFMLYLINELEAVERKVRPFWKRTNKQLQACRKLIDAYPIPTSFSQSIQSTSSYVKDVDFDMNSATTSVPISLQQAFQQALPHLHQRTQVEQQYGTLGKVKKRPLIVVVLDAVESAPEQMIRWLREGLPQLFGISSDYYVMTVAAGRRQLAGLLETELPPLTSAEMAEFLLSYALHRHRSDEIDLGYGSQNILSLLREKTSLREQIIELADGIPLLAQILTDAAVQAPQQFLEEFHDLPSGHEARIDYVVQHYVERLRARAEQQADERLWQLYWLRLYAAVPQQIDSDGLLKALLCDLDGTTFHQHTNYAELRQRLAREAFIRQTAGALRYHSLIRRGLLNELKRQSQQLWLALQERAAAWYAGEARETERLYHALQANYADSIVGWHEQVEAALTAKDWTELRKLLESAADVTLSDEDADWLTFYEAELIRVGSDSELAIATLQRLLKENLTPKLNERLAQRLETDLNFKPYLTADREQEIELPDAERLIYLVWWARSRSVPYIQANALRGLGAVAHLQDNYPQAERHYNQARSLSEAIGDRRGQANALRGLGAVAHLQDNYPQAERHYNQARSLSEAIGDRRGQANALDGLGAVAHLQGNYPQAERHYNQARSLYEAIGDRLGQANALRGLGEVARLQDNYPQAERHYNQARSLYEAIGDRLGQANALRGLGEVARLQDNYPQAERHYNQARSLSEAIGDRLGQANALDGLGAVARFQDNYPQAERHYNQARSLYEAIGDRRGQANALRGLGAVAHFQDNYPQAERHYNQARSLSEAIGDRLGQANALRGLGEVARLQGNYPQAERHYNQARSLYEAIGDRRGQANALDGLGAVAHLQDNYPQAERHYNQARSLYEAIGDRLGQANALRGLGEVARFQDNYPQAEHYFQQSFERALSIEYILFGLSVCAVVGTETLDQAERERSTEALALAHFLYSWGARFLDAAPKSRSVGNYEQALLSLRSRLDDIDSNHWEANL